MDRKIHTGMEHEHPYFYEGKYYANIDGEGFVIEDFQTGIRLQAENDPMTTKEYRNYLEQAFENMLLSVM